MESDVIQQDQIGCRDEAKLEEDQRNALPHTWYPNDKSPSDQPMVGTQLAATVPCQLAQQGLKDVRLTDPTLEVDNQLYQNSGV